MRNGPSVLRLLLLLLMTASVASATPYTFQPTRPDLWDLDHWESYKWGIDWTLPSGETIVGASLSFDNIENWDDRSNDLWVHLLDTVLPEFGDFLRDGIWVGRDYQGGGDDFADYPYGHILLNHWEDIPSTPADITYIFDAAQLTTLEEYAANGGIGLAFDPDCHYWNDGIILTVETAVPEPSSVFLSILGLAGLATLRRRLQH